jgi:hypothetical protein
MLQPLENDTPVGWRWRICRRTGTTTRSTARSLSLPIDDVPATAGKVDGDIFGERKTRAPSTTTRSAWPQWLSAAGVSGLAPIRHLELDHVYLQLQVAVDGLGIALGISAPD